jgi:phosphoglycerate dehydrogenase-like enzyme
MSTSAQGPHIAVEPAGVRDFLVKAIEAGGGHVVGPGAAQAVVWADTSDHAALAQLLDAHPNLRWVQLVFAGIEPYVDTARAHADRTWTCAKGVYAEPVAEHALALVLAARRRLDRYAREHAWSGQQGHNLLGARVAVVGGGGIAESLLRMLGPFGCDVTVVRTTPRPMEGAERVVAAEELDAALTGADVVVLALALTAETQGLIDRRRLDLLADGGVLVNVARGRHVVTEDLIPALDEGPLAGVGLDVTEPEPLPDDHPLWHRPDVIITPHTANTLEMALPLLSARVTENVRRYAAGEALLGPVDPALGY